MNRLPKDKRDKIILVGMATVAACAGIWFGLINAQVKSLAAVRTQRTTAQEQLRQGQTVLGMAKLVDEKFKESAAKLKVSEAGMAPGNDMYSWLIQTLNHFRMDYNVDIPQFSRESPAEVGVFATFPYRAAVFRVAGTAHYHDFGRFLADFENAFPYMRAQNIELEPAGELSLTSSGVNREKLGFRMELLSLVQPVAP